MAYGFVSAVHIIINGAGKCHRGHTEGRKLFRSLDGTVAADDDESLDAPIPEDFYGFFLVFLFKERLAPGGLQDRAAPEDNAADGRGLHGHHVIVQETGVAPVYAINFLSPVQGRPHDAPEGRIHARRIAAACQYCQCIHRYPSLKYRFEI